MSPFVFCMALRSTVRVDFPLRGLGVFPSYHGTGSSPISGHTAYLGPELAPVYQPSKGRELRVLNQGIEFAPDLADPDTPLTELPTGSCYAAQITPFGSHTFITVDRALFVFGLYNSVSELLVVTDIANFDAQLNSHHPGEYFLYRFHAFEHGRVHLNTKRLVARWSRWSTSSQSSLKTPSERFYVLDQSLFHS